MTCVSVLLLYEECLGGSRSRAGAFPGRGLSHLSQLARGRLARGQRLARSSLALPVARAAGTALTGTEGLLCCHWHQNASCTSPRAPLGFPKRDRPGFTSCWVRKVGWHSKGVAVTDLRTAGRNFLLAEFSLSLHLGENLKDIWTHWNHLVLSCWSVSTWKRSICWKSSSFGTSCSLRCCVVETSDTESQGV